MEHPSGEPSPSHHETENAPPRAFFVSAREIAIDRASALIPLSQSGDLNNSAPHTPPRATPRSATGTEILPSPPLAAVNDGRLAYREPTPMVISPPSTPPYSPPTPMGPAAPTILPLPATPALAGSPPATWRRLALPPALEDADMLFAAHTRIPSPTPPRSFGDRHSQAYRTGSQRAEARAYLEASADEERSDQISQEQAAQAERTARAIAADFDLLYTGYSHFFLRDELFLVDGDENAIEVPAPIVKRALDVIGAVLSIGPFEEDNTDYVFRCAKPSTWFRMARFLVAAITRGALSAKNIHKLGNFPLDLGEDDSTLHQSLPAPGSDGEALHLIASQLAGLTDVDAAKGGDAHPETVYDRILSRAMIRMEEEAETEARAKGPDIAKRIRTQLLIDEVDRLASEKLGDPGMREALEADANDEAKRLIKAENFDDLEQWRAVNWQRLINFELAKIPQAALEARALELYMAEGHNSEWAKEQRDRARQTVAQEIPGYLQEERESARQLCRVKRAAEAAQWAHKDWDDLLTEKRREMETEVRNEVIRLRQAKIDTFERTLDLATREQSMAAVREATIRLGMDAADFNMARVPRTIQKKKKVAPKSVTAKTAAAEDARGRSASVCSRKRTNSGSRAPSAASSIRSEAPCRLPDDGDDVTPMHSPARLAGPSLQTVTPPLCPLDAKLRSATSSVHNPANQMDTTEDLSPAPLKGAITDSPIPPCLEAQADDLVLDTRESRLMALMQKLIQPVTGALTKVIERLDKVEGEAKEKSRKAAPAAKAPAPPRPPPASAPREEQRKQAAPAAPATLATPNSDGAPGAALRAAPAATLAPTPARVDDDDDDGFRPVVRQGWNAIVSNGLHVTAKGVQQWERANGKARIAAAAQGRTPNGNLRRSPQRPTPDVSRTEVTVARGKGLADPEKEKGLRTTAPQSIVMSVRTKLERQVKEPLIILGGRWSSNPNSSNFIWVLAGQVSDDRILSFEKWLCEPFAGSVLIPNEGWTWAQVRGVPTTDPHGVIWEEHQLLSELRNNELFKNALLPQAPRWQNGPGKIKTETATVMIAYCDKTGELSTLITRDRIYMFGQITKVVVAGDRPTIIQCGRCHEIGHNASAPICRVPKTAYRCFICGGGHDGRDHSYHCKGQHRIASRLPCARGVPTPETNAGPGRRLPPPPPRRPAPQRAPEATATTWAPDTATVAEGSNSAIAAEGTNATAVAEFAVTETPEAAPRPASPSTVQPQVAPARPRARMVTKDTDTAKPRESSTDRAAARRREKMPASATLTPLPAHRGLSDLAIKAQEELESLRKEDKSGRAYVTFPSGKKDYAWLEHLSPEFLARRERRKAQLCDFLTSEAEAVAEELTPEELEVQRSADIDQAPQAAGALAAPAGNNTLITPPNA
ncbi:hypothetical protein EDB85DRAFT_1891660 [Lactarius pseudohatsudake]|nr:hypothetical protein EDB85DRAFT_1891660 [Lactarius pseudohatsudake]